jgi:anti-anti-sigma factor
MPPIDPALPQAVVVADGDRLRVDLSGDLDLAGRSLLDDVLDKVTAAPPTSVLVDLTAVTFLSSDALNFLARVRQHAVSGGHEVTLAGARRTALRVLEVSGFTKVFRIAEAP